MSSGYFLRTHQLFTVSLIVCSMLIGCAKKAAEVKGPAQIVTDGRRIDDQSRCDNDLPNRESVESSVPGSLTPNVRRVYRFSGEGLERIKILICREVDTNFDGVKDVVRTYDDDGLKLSEQADADYNGKIDTWIKFDGASPGLIEIDSSGDGNADETRYFVNGKLVRIQRDTNGDQKPDILETYEQGELIRMGVDLNFDGRIDRWDMDKLREVEAAVAESERKKKVESQADEKVGKSLSCESNDDSGALSAASDE